MKISVLGATGSMGGLVIKSAKKYENPVSLVFFRFTLGIS